MAMRGIGTVLGGALLATTLLAGSAQAVELRFGHWLPPVHPLHTTGFVPWAESIAEASGGDVTIAFYPANQLGAPQDHYDMARDGIADITFINPGYQPGRFPIISAGEIPFTVSSAATGSVAFDQWYRQYVADEMGDVHFCLAHFHDPGALHSRAELRVPADIAGLTVRPAHATMARFIGSIGGTNAQVPAPEVRELLARGTADALTFPWASLYIFGLQDLVTYHLDMPFYVTTFAIVMNRASYDRMSDAQRAVIDDHCTNEWAGRISEGWIADEAAGRDRIANEPGHIMVVPTDEEVAQWRAAAEPLVDQWKADVAAVGGDADAIWDSLTSLLAEHGALFE